MPSIVIDVRGLGDKNSSTLSKMIWNGTSFQKSSVSIKEELRTKIPGTCVSTKILKTVLILHEHVYFRPQHTETRERVSLSVQLGRSTHVFPQELARKGDLPFPAALEITCFNASSPSDVTRSVTFLSRSIEKHSATPIICPSCRPLEQRMHLLVLLRSQSPPHHHVHDVSRGHTLNELCVFQQRLGVSQHLCNRRHFRSAHHKLIGLFVRGEVSPILPTLWPARLSNLCQCATLESRHGVSALHVWRLCVLRVLDSRQEHKT